MNIDRFTPERLENVKKALKKIKLPHKVMFIVMGIVSTAWFLIRVIPKPSRATYPCMRAAAPFMSSFVIYILSITSTAFLFKNAKKSFAKSKYVLAGFAILAGFFSIVILKSLNTNEVYADTQQTFEANAPIGEANGAVPGRVVWVHDPEATNENMTNTAGDYWIENTNSAVVDSMFSEGILNLTNEESVEEAWDTLFRYFNYKRYGVSKAYEKGEKITIKINLTNSCCGKWDGETKKTSQLERMDATPEVVLAMLKQLVDVVGVEQSDIYCGDPYRTFRDAYWDVCHSVYPDVNYIDQKGKNGRYATKATEEQLLIFSDKKETSSLPQTYVDAAYFINMSCLKTHNEGGITLGAKNHQGSVLEPGDPETSQSAFYMHYSLPANSEGNGQYRHLVDYLGHEHMGGKTLLNVVDGIWAGKNWSSEVEKWAMYPFNNDYPNSLFMSQDPVAVESVCYDFLLAEYGLRSQDLFPYIPGTGDYLMQAADQAYWPEGIQYDPEGDGTIIGSLGVHEHWNNDIDKQYSRNLGFEEGIELVYVPQMNVAPTLTKEFSMVGYENTSRELVISNNLYDHFTDHNKDVLTFTVTTDNQKLEAMVQDSALIIKSEMNFIDEVKVTVEASDGEESISTDFMVPVNTGEKVRAMKAETAPDIDGVGDEAIWDDVPWTDIGQVWIPYGTDISAEDFSGRYKVVWTEDHIYMLAEIIDDVLDVDNPEPLSEYYKYDCLEIFIDEDNSGGDHTYDYNAFAYHVSAEGNAVDLGTDKKPHLYDHVDMAMGTSDYAHVWELAIAIYDDSFDYDGTNTPVTLEAGKELGFSVAYCDADNLNDINRESFFGSVYVEEENHNDHWKNASEFGSLMLLETGNTNSSPYLMSALDDIVLDKNGTTTLVEDLNTVFNDPDGDELQFTASAEGSNLSVNVEGGSLIVTTTEFYDGTSIIHVEATDGTFTVNESFEIYYDLNKAPETEGIIDDYLAEELNTKYEVVNDVKALFTDPNDDELTYTVESDNENVDAALTGEDLLWVRVKAEISSPATVTLKADDGEFVTTITFEVDYIPSAVNNITGFSGSFSCYPNPVKEYLNISISNDIYDYVNFRVTDASGRIIIDESTYKNVADFTYRIDLSNLQNGIYILEASMNNERTTQIIFK